MKSNYQLKTFRFFAFAFLFFTFSSNLFSQAASNLFPDITEFKLEFPLDDNGDDYEGVNYNDRDDPHIKNEIEDNLNGYVAPSPYNQYFFVSGNELVMRAHCAGALTSVNAYPRCELRQQINGADTFWDYSDEHELNVTFRITEVPDLKREVCVVQAKGTNTPSTTSGTKEVLRVEYRADGGSGWHLEVNESSGPSDILDYSIGQTVHIRLYINDDEVTLEMENLDNGDTYNYNYNSDFSHGYFKTGCYTQSSIWEEKNGVGDEDPDARGEVRFSQISLGAGGGTTCVPQVPGGRSVSNVGQNSATLSWNSVPDVLNYDVRWKPTNSSSWSYNTNYTNTSLNISGLSSNTQYEWQVKSACADGSDTNYGDGPGPNFTTSSSGGSFFTPDPNKTYYIENVRWNERLAANGSSQDAYGASINTTGPDVEWKFVAKGNGDWHVQRAAGGSVPRIRTDNSVNADMQATSSSGSYTYYEFAASSTSGAYYMTLPDGPSNYKRLQMNGSGNILFMPTSNQGTWVSWRFVEVNSSGNNLVHIRKRNALSYAIDGSGQESNGQNVYLWGQNSNNVNQQWVEIDRGGGFYSYQKQGTNYCLDGGNGGANGQNVYLWTCGSTNQNQQWQKINTDNGFVKLKKRNANFAINGGSGGSNGQNVNLYNSSNSSQNLQWRIDYIGSSITGDDEDKVEHGSSGESVYTEADKPALQDFDKSEIELRTVNNQIKIYPNPANEQIIIAGKENADAIQIIDITGKVLIQTNENRIIISHLQTGVYFVRSKDGSITKFIKL